MGEDLPKSSKSSFKSWLKLIMIISFVANAYRFLNTDGNTLPLVGTLFNMILILAIFFIIHHKNDLDNDKNNILKQTYLDQYFKRFKNC